MKAECGVGHVRAVHVEQVVPVPGQLDGAASRNGYLFHCRTMVGKQCAEIQTDGLWILAGEVQDAQGAPWVLLPPDSTRGDGEQEDHL